MLSVQTMWAEAPANYYSTADGKSGEGLREALQSIIDNHTVVSYDNLWNLYEASDTHEDGSIWDMYSTCEWSYSEDQCGNYGSVCDCYNREHSVPKSWFNEGRPMYSDAFHLYPTDGKVNGQRSNYPFGECENGESAGGRALGRLGSSTFPGYSGRVFEPDDEYKGDFARTYFYMATRYAGQCESWGQGVFSNANYGLTDYAVALFMKWHREDPVSEKERVRNDAIYGINNNTGYKQGNRNPFIDYPCLAEYIWGSKKGESVDFEVLMSSYNPDFDSSDLTGCDCTPTEPAIIYPDNGSTLNIGGANIGETVKSTVTVNGVLISVPVSVSLSGNNAALFSLSRSELQPSEVNSGCTLEVTYTPTSIGTHTATLTLSNSEMEAVTVTVTGSCRAELVSPQDQTLYLNENNVGATETLAVTVKATNISSSLTLSLTGEDADLFSLSKNNLTADEAKAGSEITLSYTPAALGTAYATLEISCDELAERTIEIQGITVFNALPATDVSKRSFTANWTNAGVAKYTVDIYTKTETEGGRSVIVDIPNLTGVDDIENDSHLSGSGRILDENGVLRLGSGSGDGSIVTKGIDFSNGGRVTVRAAQYHDDNSYLKVEAGNTEVGNVKLTGSFSEYSFDIPSSAGNVTISQGQTGERVLINSLKIEAGQESTLKKQPVEGYPTVVNNTTSHIVTGLAENTDYFYTVTLPDGTVSDEMAVRTSGTSTGIDYVEQDKLLYYQDGGGSIHILNLTPGCPLYIYSVNGMLISVRDNCRAEETFTLPTGIYILKTENQYIKVTAR